MGEPADRLGVWQGLAAALGYPGERAMLEDLYTNEGMSLEQISRRLGMGRATISRRIGIWGIKKRGRGGPNNPAKQKTRLHCMDQRLVFSLPIPVVAELLSVSESLVYKYKHATTGGKFDAIRDNQPDSGVEEILEP